MRTFFMFECSCSAFKAFSSSALTNACRGSHVNACCYTKECVEHGSEQLTEVLTWTLGLKLGQMEGSSFVNTC